jgi:hypothetical protein
VYVISEAVGVDAEGLNKELLELVVTGAVVVAVAGTSAGTVI